MEVKNSLKILPMVMLTAFFCTTAMATDETVESKYSQPGEYTVVNTITNWNSEYSWIGPGYTLFYPQGMTDNNHAVIVWGNGTDNNVGMYENIIHHLVSHGFIVIGSNDGQQGDGEDIHWMAYLVAIFNQFSTQPYYGKLNGMFATVGHSFGAAGALNASYRYSYSWLINSVACLSLPYYVDWLSWKPDVDEINVPVFMMRGNGLGEYTVCSWNQLYNTYFDPMVDNGYGIPVAAGTRDGANHAEPVDNGDAPGNWGDGNDGNLYKGYLTASLCAILNGDWEASLAFLGSSAEFLDNPNWPDAETGNLGAP